MKKDYGYSGTQFKARAGSQSFENLEHKVLMEKEENEAGRSRVHFNASSNSEDAELDVVVTSFDPSLDPTLRISNPSIGLDEQDNVPPSKDITDAKMPPSFIFDETEGSDTDEGDHAHSNHRDEQPHRSLEVERSPRSRFRRAWRSPLSSPIRYSRGHDERSSDIPLVDLNLSSPPPSHLQRRHGADSTVERATESRDSIGDENAGRREAERLIEEHSKRRRPRSREFFRRRLSSASDLFRSGASTPDEDGDVKHYTFTAGVLTNLLKL
jgi:hypothetical protein